MAVDAYSLSFRPEEESRLVTQGYSLVGLAGKLGTWHRLRRLASLLTTTEPRPQLVVGDLFGTYAWREVLAEHPDAICVRGEGESSWQGLLDAFASAPDPRDREGVLERIPNLVFQRSGRVIETKREAVNLAAFARTPSRTFLPDALARQAQVQVEGSRGCPWSKCSFCTIPSLSGVTWRPFALPTVMEQFVELSEAGARSVYFTDSDFLGSSIARAHEFADALLAAKRSGRVCADLNFYLNLQATGVIGGAGNSRDDCTSMLRHLKAAGLREVFVGVESGARGQVRRYAKASTPLRNHDAVSHLHDLGLQSDVGFIMFDPDVTTDELLFNLDFLRDSGLWNHPSRFTKALRIQPDTGFADSYFSGHLPPMNVNNLSYPYSFRDQDADSVYLAFRRWELGHLDFETLVQGASKGEVPDEGVRDELRAYLGALRSIDLEFLRELVLATRAGSLRSRALAGKETELRSRMSTMMRNRPSAVDAHAERLGVRITDGVEFDERYERQYRTLNAYEDPVYPTMDRLLGEEVTAPSA